MSNPLLNWAFAAPLTRSSEKFLLVCLANHANGDGTCFPSYTSLSEQTSLNRKTVISGIQALVNAGLIIDTGDRKGATKQIAVFKLVMRGLIPTEETIPKTEPLPKSPEIGTVPILPDKSPVFTLEQSQKRTERVPKTGHGTPINPQGTLIEPPVHRACQSNDFDAFWRAYPRKVAKQDARRAWDKAIKHATSEQIMDGLAHYGFMEDPTKRPHAATWLIGKRWEYEPDTEPPTVMRAINGHRSGAMELVEDYDLDVITPIEKQFPMEERNGHAQKPASRHALVDEIGPPDERWPNASDEAANWPVRGNFR